MGRQFCVLGVLIATVACSSSNPLAPTSVPPSADSNRPVVFADGGADHIVNVDAEVNSVRRPVFVVLAPGTYEVTPVGVEQGGAWDAWTAWFAHNCTEPAGCRATWPTTSRGWRNGYDVVSRHLVSAAVEGAPLIPTGVAPAVEERSGSYFLQAGSESRYHVDDLLVYPDPALALSAALTSTLTIASSGPVGFAISDDLSRDNRGGVSLRLVRQ